MLGGLVSIGGDLDIISRKNCKGAKALIRDPVHNLAKHVFNEVAGEENELEGHYILPGLAVVVSVLSLPVWATFWPVWGGLFDSDGDDGLRPALSMCSLGVCCVVLPEICRDS